MKSRAIVLSIAASLAASLVAVNAVSAQPWAAIAAGGISNPNAPGGNVAINVGPPAPPSTACDPLHVGSSGMPACLRLSGVGPIGACGLNCNFARIGFDPGGAFLPIGAPNSLAIGTQGCANDVVIGTNGAVGGFIRLATGGAGGLIERVTVSNAGRVGINNPAPVQALDVTGTINVTQDILLGNRLRANGSFGSPNDVLTIDAFGIPTWTPVAGPGSAWVYGGNAVATTQALGTTTNFDLPFITNGTTRMTITSAGDVGIGTTSPTQALDVVGNIAVSGNVTTGGSVNVGGDITLSASSLIYDGTGSSGAVNDVLTIVGGVPTWQAPAPAGSAWALGGNPTSGVQALGSTNNDVPIIANGTTWIYVDDASGGVAIGSGVSSAAATLDVTGDVQFSGRLMPGGSIGTSGQLLVSNASGVPSWQNPSTVFTSVGWLVGGNSLSSGTYVMGPTGSSANLDIQTHNGTSATSRIFVASGSTPAVGINQTSPSYTLDVNGSLFATSATFSSDARLKQDIVTIDNALAKVTALRGVSYTFRNGEFSDRNLPTGKQIGLIAQEVEQVVPEVVNTDRDGYKSIAYQNLVSLLVESTKEQQGIIENQRTTIDNLSARIARLEALIDPAAKPVTPETKEDVQVVQLDQNTPNPFDRSTTIRYMVPSSIGNAEMVIFEAATGREVERFIIAGRGEGEVTVSVAGLASGNYVYGIVADGKLAQTRTMIVAR